MNSSMLFTTRALFVACAIVRGDQPPGSGINTAIDVASPLLSLPQLRRAKKLEQPPQHILHDGRIDGITNLLPFPPAGNQVRRAGAALNKTPTA
jgi:hypothetical protein